MYEGHGWKTRLITWTLYFPEKRVIIDLEKWDEYANEEVKKGQLAKEMHLNGVDTIFCLDISMSMKGKPLQQAKAFIHNCIEGKFHCFCEQLIRL